MGATGGGGGAPFFVFFFLFLFAFLVAHLLFSDLATEIEKERDAYSPLCRDIISQLHKLYGEKSREKREKCGTCNLGIPLPSQSSSPPSSPFRQLEQSSRYSIYCRCTEYTPYQTWGEGEKKKENKRRSETEICVIASSYSRICPVTA